MVGAENADVDVDVETGADGVAAAIRARLPARAEGFVEGPETTAVAATGSGATGEAEAGTSVASGAVRRRSGSAGCGDWMRLIVMPSG